MLSHAEIKAQLARYSYLPGWYFETYEDPWEGLFLRIRCDEVPNAYRPEENTVLDIHTWIGPIVDLAHLDRYLEERLRRCIIHEHLEFFRRDGQILFDPHAHPTRT